MTLNARQHGMLSDNIGWKNPATFIKNQTLAYSFNTMAKYSQCFQRNTDSHPVFVLKKNTQKLINCPPFFQDMFAVPISFQSLRSAMTYRYTMLLA